MATVEQESTAAQNGGGAATIPVENPATGATIAHVPDLSAAEVAALAKRVRDVRARVAFYASTPGYRATFDAHGLTDLALELAQLSKAQRWEEMPPRISDDVLHTYASLGRTWWSNVFPYVLYNGATCDALINPDGSERPAFLAYRAFIAAHP